MVDYEDADLSGSRFREVNLSGTRFERVNLTGVQVRAADFVDATFRAVGFDKVVMRGVELADVDIYGEIGRLTINGVDVGPLVTAELDRRDPDRPKMRPDAAAGFRAAWDVVEHRWAATVDRARHLDPPLLHESVNGEWSFIETLRHLVFATECWVHRGLLGDPAPWDALSLPWDEMKDTPGVPRDRAARPSLDQVLALRRDRMRTVREYVDGLTDEALAGDTVVPDGPGWPPAGETLPVRECLLVVLNEEWEHRLYAERDLSALEARWA